MQTHMFYLVLNKDYELEEYLLTIRDRKQRQILSQYKLGEKQTGNQTRKTQQGMAT